MENVQVSVICNTYNHGAVIRDALEGFVKQKTNFLYEVLIHDDCSTDDTKKIIIEYERKYPEIIKPIFEEENQYSKGIDICLQYQIPRAQGKYIAFCEGDDYWTDPQKLQKQYDALENHPQIDICAHAADVYNCWSNKMQKPCRPSEENCIFSAREVILGGGGFVATASLFMKKSIWEKPAPYYKAYGIDYMLQIWGSMRGGMLFLSDTMSVYRLMMAGSWSETNALNVQKLLQHEEKYEKAMNILNQETNQKYQKEIERKIKESRFDLYFAQKQFRKLLQKDMKEAYQKQGRKRKIAIWIGAIHPALFDAYKKAMKRIRRK